MSLFAGIFGACFSGGEEFGSAWINRKQTLAAEQANIMATFNGQAMRGLPPGIFWERTGGNTHRVVIRREVEYVPDWSRLGMENAVQPQQFGLENAP
jgi:hypothetical protein